MTPTPVTWRRGRHHWQIYLFILPCFAFIGVFMYYPVFSGLYHSAFNWNGGDVERFTSHENYTKLFLLEPEFWKAFKNALIIGFFNVLKMAPSIVTAVCLHRVRSDRMQFFYRIGFVIPMVIPELVTTLLWKAFYDPTTGVLNVSLKATGLLDMLGWMSEKAAGIGNVLTPYTSWLPAGGMVLLLPGAIVPTAACWVAARQYQRRSLPAPKVYVAGKLFGTVTVACMVVVMIADSLAWAGTLFRAGESPAWLGEPKYSMFALVLWNFPWVGSFGVLAYLAVLQNIGRDIYEAAEVDGAGWFAKFRYIELPLLMRQVRVMMVLVIMGSIKDAGHIMALFGIEGGPGGAVQVPSLFMFREAFQSQQMGYACAMGVVIFVIILVMTKINDWLVKPAD